MMTCGCEWLYNVGKQGAGRGVEGDLYGGPPQEPARDPWNPIPIGR